MTYHDYSGKVFCMRNRYFQNRRITSQEIRNRLEHFVADLIASEHYDDEEGAYKFPDGSYSSFCTVSAILIAKRFHGKVLGYQVRNNPTAFIGEQYCEGHDFALIHSRWIVDYWAYQVSHLSTQPVIDLNLSTERKLAVQLYGNPRCWEMVVNYEG